MHHWRSAKSLWVVARNYAAIVVARHSPSLRLKNWLFRRLGMSVEDGARWALESTPDVFFPELITVKQDAIIGYDTTILCHEFLQNEYRTGPVTIGTEAMVGAGAIVLPGVEIGAGASVAANSLVTEDVPPETTVAGVPAEPVE
ncbi:MAG: acyltransferase [Halodesulfurarchaeum sp.]